MLPEGWKESTVGKACRIKNNLRLPISETEREKMKGPFPYIGPTGILDYINEYRIDEEFVTIGEDGDHFLKYKEKEMTFYYNEKSNANNHAHIICNSENCLAKWFGLFFQHRDITSFITRQGAKRYKLTKDALERLPILLPPLAEQKKIAEILSTWDEAISVVDKQLENCRQQKKALMQKLLTGKKRLPGFSGEWREVKLGDVAQVEKGTPLNGNNIVLGPYPVIAGGKTVTTWHKEYTHENVITVSASGAYAGYVSMHTQKIWASDCSVIAPLKYELDLNFLFQNMLFRQEDIYKLQVGGAQPHVYPKDLIKFYIPLPSLREQQAISDILGLADKQRCNLEKQAVLLQEEKKSLMQQLLTGKKRVAV